MHDLPQQKINREKDSKETEELKCCMYHSEPPFLPGLRGLMLSVMLASLMSSLTSIFNSAILAVLDNNRHSLMEWTH